MNLINIPHLSVALCVMMLTIGQAQVAIGTSNPKGLLDIQNSATMGLIYPRIVLTATNVAAPVVNPNGGNLEVGTVVYNTNYTTTGTNDVYPGIYAWDGTQWTTQFIKEDAVMFEQTPLDFRVPYSGGYRDVPGLGIGSSFTAKYTGTYRIIANFNFGAGKVRPPTVSSGDNIRMATQEGYFLFTFNAIPYYIYTHSYSAHNKGIGGGTYYDTFRHDSSLILYEDLVAGQTYTYRLRMDMQVSNTTDYNNSSTDSYGHIGIGVPCSVEFTFLEGN